MDDIDFEVITYDKIKLNVGQTIDQKLYEVFRREKQCNYKLIDHSLYSFLMDKTIGVDSVKFDQNDWDENIAPKLNEKVNSALINFQKEAVYKMIKRKRCLNASDMGLGKSLQGLTALIACKKPNRGDLILCPGGLRTNWAAEIEKWYGGHRDYIIIDKAGAAIEKDILKKILFGDAIKVVSYDMAARLFGKLKPSARSRSYFNTVLLDESHYVKESKSKRFQNLQSIIKCAENVFLLSGTPKPNRPIELFTQLSLLHPKIFTDKMDFAKRFCDGKFDKFNRFDDKGTSKIDELKFLMTKVMIRIRREDHMNDIPNVLRNDITIAPSTHSMKFKKQMKRFNDALGEMDTNAFAIKKVQSIASEMFRETSVIKVKPVLEYLECLLNDGTDEKAVLFCTFHNMLDEVSEFLNKKCPGNFVSISGKTPMKDRLSLINEVTHGNKQFILATIGSCSTGLNMIPIAKMIFLELSWELSTILQAECRIKRIGGAKHLYYEYLVCKGTLDTMVFNKLQKKNVNNVEIIENGKDYGDLAFDKIHKKRKLN